jgi:hypothetical protein
MHLDRIPKHGEHSPLATGRLGDDGDESLEGTEDGSVDHDWSLELVVGRAAWLLGTPETQVESFGKVEIQLAEVSLRLSIPSMGDGCGRLPGSCRTATVA